MDKNVETVYQNKRFQTNNGILCLNENTFFICSQPLSPNNVAKCFVDVYFFSNIEKGRRGGYLSQGEGGEFTPSKKVGNFHVSQQLLSMIIVHSKVIMINSRFKILTWLESIPDVPNRIAKHHGWPGW